jgi:hypothetical protein
VARPVFSIACVLLLAMLPATAGGRTGTELIAVHAHVVMGFTSQTGGTTTVAGMATSKPFGRGGVSAKLDTTGSSVAGPFAIFDGRGRLLGQARATTPDGQNYTGTFTVRSGSGRFAGATGVLRFSGALDSSSVPAVTVLPGTLDGNLRVQHSTPPAPSTRRIHISYAGEQAKVKAVGQSGYIDLTSAATTALRGLGPGVVLIQSKVSSARTRPQTWTFYGQNGTWSARGVRDLDSSSPTRLTVTGGTRHFRGAHGTLLYKITEDGGVSGRVAYELAGDLQF